MKRIDYWRWPGIRITLAWVVVGMAALLKLVEVVDYLDQPESDSVFSAAGPSVLGAVQILFEGGIIVVLLLAYIAWEYSRLRK